MADEARYYGDYAAVGDGASRSTYLHVATLLGDLMERHLTLVGGLVPSLLIDQATLPEGAEAHCGTCDVDLGLSLALLDDERYEEIAKHLRQAGFSMDENEYGRPTRQRWRTPDDLPKVTVDFLIPQVQATDEGGTLRDLSRDFAAIVTPGLQLAAQDWRLVEIAGQTLLGERATRKLRVCGPGAYAVLKARAFRGRGRGKDAYDLCYVLQHYGDGIQDVALALKPLLGDPDAQEAMDWLAEDFAELDSTGPTRTAMFLRQGQTDDDLQADALGAVKALLRLVG
jgi:hypothetical protein